MPLHPSRSSYPYRDHDRDPDDVDDDPTAGYSRQGGFNPSATAGGTSTSAASAASFTPHTSRFLCPLCHSPQVVPRDLGKKTGAAIGTIAGAAGGASGVLAGATSGAEVGFVMGALAGPAGVPVGTVTGAVIGALSGGIAGCAVGAALGEAVDESVLRNRRCLSCGHTYSVPRH